MRIKPGAFFFIFRFVKSFDFEDDWACAIIAASNHDAVVIGPSVHNRAALKCGIDISADAVPGFSTRKFRFPVASEMPKIVFTVGALKNEFVADMKAWAHAAFWICKIFLLEIGMQFLIDDGDFANMFHRKPFLDL